MKLKMELMGMLLVLLLCSSFVRANTLGDIHAADGMINVTLPKQLGPSGNPNEKVENRQVRISFSHSDHGYGFGKMVWDKKRVIKLEASIKKAAAAFPVYPYNVRIVLYDPQNKIIRNEGQNIGVTWQNYEWGGPTLRQTWDPAITSSHAIEQKLPTELSANPFGAWTIIFYKDMNLGKDAFGKDKWHWEPLAQYNFEIIDGTKPGVAPPPADGGSITPAASDVFGVAGQTVSAIVVPGHKVQVWEVLPEYTQTGTYQISIQHAKAGNMGSFFYTAWADIDGDGVPDQEIDRSERKIVRTAGEWSSWTFKNHYKRIFIGNLWDRADEQIYYQMERTLQGYSGLDNQVYYSREINQAPRQKVGPRYTNIRFKIIPGQSNAIQTYTVDAVKNCVFLNQTENIPQKAVKIKLETDTRYRLQLDGMAYYTQQNGKDADPMPGVVLFYPTNEQDGFASIYKVMVPGETIVFTTPSEEPENVFLLAFVMDYWSGSANKGAFQLRVEKVSAGNDGNSPPNSFTNPLNIDNRFVAGPNKDLNRLDKSTGALRWIACEYPWAAIEGDGSDRFRYYAFNVKPGSKAIFDIDRGFRGNQPGSADLKIVLWDAQGNPLGGSDNLGAYSWFFGSDPGSEQDGKGFDPYFEWTFAKGGAYIIGVDVSGAQEGTGGWSSETGLKPGTTYTLNIAIENHEYHAVDSADYFKNLSQQNETK
jgi:hypothetical protein